ncbi:hypothetical protein CANINC_004499 [Pichia inconspicua]|uniref:Protein kinase domain-containing protein n=1 Tax=Pichia inconspicua TaxID=52247 RepID=A0A4T0WWM5_9ASCO|nr:hypothetical protein CANINC_004499 [[Candida] inconspicua]
MNFLTKTLGTLTGYSIPYTFGEIVDPSIAEDPSSNSLWKIYDGVSDKENIPVTIFEFDLKNPVTQRYTSLIQNSVKRHRSLSLLPGVLNIIEVIESDRFIYIITEHVRPLSESLTKYDDNTKVLGVYQLTVALKFINIEGTSVHGNLRLPSVYVTDAAEWKIGGFEFSFKYNENTDFYGLYGHYSFCNKDKLVPPEYESNGSDCFRSQLSGNKALKFDSYLFGILIFEIMKGRTPSGPEAAKAVNLGGIPINKLVAPSIGLRITSEQFLKNGESSYFATPEISAYSRFSEISVLNSNDKLDIFKILVFGNVAIQFLENKVQFELAKTFDQTNSNENNIQTILLYLMYSIVKRSDRDSQSFKMYFKPAFFKAFTFSDRAVRTILLKILPTIVDQLDKYEVQDKIYPNLVTGFQDTDITVRTETLLSISCIMDKITDRQLNNDLLRYLAKLQADLNPQLRANTVICLNKISEKMQPNTRIGVLITAFGKALKDSDYVTRLCAVRGFKSSIQYFEPEICCSKVLSALAPALLEKSAVIRNEAEETFEMYMQKIRDAAAGLSSIEEDSRIEADVEGLNNTMNNLSLENLGESLIGSISNIPTPSTTPFPESRMNSNNFAKPTQSSDNLIDDFELAEDDGWGIDDEPIAEPQPRSMVKPKLVPSFNSTKSINRGQGPKTAPVPVPAKKLVLGKQKPTKINLNLATKVEEDDDGGWGDGW